MEKTDKPKLHIWNKNALVQEFKDGKVTEHLKMRYYIVETLLLWAIIYLYYFLQPTSVLAATLELVVFAGLSIWGIRWCYQGNLLGDGKQFLDRFICINFVVSIRIIVIYSLLIGTLVGVFAVVLDSLLPTLMPGIPLVYVYTVGVFYLYFRMTRQAIIEVSKGGEAA